jgi:hypothetical protein
MVNTGVLILFIHLNEIKHIDGHPNTQICLTETTAFFSTCIVTLHFSFASDYFTVPPTSKFVPSGAISRSLSKLS